MEYPEESIAALSSLGKLLEKAPMAGYTSFRTGGPCDILLWPAGVEQTREALGLASRQGVPVTVIGGGTNLLVSDRGIRGLVLRFAADGGLTPRLTLEEGLVRAEAGVTKEDFIDFALQKGLGGVEFMAGIPGCIGGGICMNAGTVIGSFAGILTDIEIVTAEGGISRIVPGVGMAGYRNMGLPAGAVVTAGRFSLPVDPDPAGTAERVRALVEERWQKHPLQYPSAGSVFKNPPGHASWKLVNDAGLRGRTEGGAMVSDLHTNFIVNTGNATTEQVRDLIEIVRSEVRAQFGIELETEVRMLGEF